MLFGREYNMTPRRCAKKREKTMIFEKSPLTALFLGFVSRKEEETVSVTEK